MRLTQTIREKLITTLVDHATGKQLKELEANESKVAMAVYRSVFSEKIEAMADKLNEAVPGIVHTNSNIQINISGHGYTTLKMDRRRVTTYFGQPTSLFKEAITPEILSDVMRHIKSNSDYKESRAKALAIATGIISPLNTTDKLKVKWPEAWTLLEPLVAEFEAVAASRAAKSLPAIANADLNAIFDLPVDATVAA